MGQKAVHCAKATIKGKAKTSTDMERTARIAGDNSQLGHIFSGTRAKIFSPWSLDTAQINTFLKARLRNLSLKRAL